MEPAALVWFLVVVFFSALAVAESLAPGESLQAAIDAAAPGAVIEFAVQGLRRGQRKPRPEPGRT